MGLRRTWILDRWDGERVRRGPKGQVEESGFGIEGTILWDLCLWDWLVGF
jgi:hypothetical protein